MSSYRFNSISPKYISDYYRLKCLNPIYADRKEYVVIEEVKADGFNLDEEDVVGEIIDAKAR